MGESTELLREHDANLVRLFTRRWPTDGGMVLTVNWDDGAVASVKFRDRSSLFCWLHWMWMEHGWPEAEEI